MYPWFVFKGVDSRAMGLWVSKLPAITRPAERKSSIIVPGRAGELTMLEGDEVYEAYQKEIVVTCRNEAVNAYMMDWLRGSGDLIICTEDQYVYHARIAAEVSFTRLGNWLSQATLAFWCEPFKYERYPSTITTTATSGTILNPGTASSKPKITVEHTGALYIAIGDQHMSFEHLPGEVVIDCDAQIITTKAKAYDGTAYYYVGDYCTFEGSNNYSEGLYRFTTEGIGSTTEWEYIGEIVQDYEYFWTGFWAGEFFSIRPGSSFMGSDQGATMTIEPRWRWV